MATLEGNELVNVESVTALMSLFGAKYCASFFDGYVLSGRSENRQTPIYKYLSSDGTKFSLTQTGSAGDFKNNKFSITFGEDSLWHVTFGIRRFSNDDNFEGEYTISMSDGSLVLQPSKNTIEGALDRVINYFDAYIRVKKGTKFTVNCSDTGSAYNGYGYFYFDAFRVC